eukprot:scaffold9366_cov118-Isochrysis_galbana.AAC.8
MVATGGPLAGADRHEVGAEGCRGGAKWWRAAGTEELQQSRKWSARLTRKGEWARAGARKRRVAQEGG